MNWWEKPVLSLDLETTGTDPHSCEVVSWAVARVAPSGRVLEHHGGIVRTESWGEGAEAIHGITREESQAGMSVVAMLSGIEAALYLGDSPLVVFNAAYDLTTLSQYGLHMKHPILDPMVMGKAVNKYHRASLEALYARYFRSPPPGAHDALADATAAARLAFKLAEQEKFQIASPELHEAQIAWRHEQAAGLQAWKRRNGTPDAIIDGSWPVRSAVVV